MPTQLYAVNQAVPVTPSARDDRALKLCGELERKLKAETQMVQQTVANIVPVLRQELAESERRLGHQLTQYARACEQLAEQTAALQSRLQMLEIQVEKNVSGRKRPAPLRLTPALPTTVEGHRGYHDPTIASSGGATADFV